MHLLEKFIYCPICGAKTFEINSERSKKCRECGFEYWANSSASIAVIIYNSEGEILLTRRAYEPSLGTLDLPGGFVDPGETAEEALRREIKEELSIEVEAVKYLGALPNQYPYSGIVINTLDLIFEARYNKYQEIKTADDVASASFYKVSDINIDEIGLKSIKKVIKKIQNHEKF